MGSDKTIDKYTRLLTSIYSNLMLREIDATRNGNIKHLTFHEIHTIEIIGDLGEAPVSQLAKNARVTQSTMSTMIDKLVKKGMVERTRSEDDRRVVKIRLTPIGSTTHKEHEDVHREVTKSWLNTLDEKEQMFLLKMLEKIASFIRK